MKPYAIRLLVCCFCLLLCLAHADEFKPGSGFPTNRNSKMDLPLSSFINQRGPTTDWSLVVLLRGEKHYTLNDKANRELLSKPVTQGDVVVLDDAASSFLVWRRQNPESELNLFWKANPELLDKALRYSSSATGGASSTPSSAVSDPSEAQPSISSVNTPPVVQPAKSKIADAKPTTSTPSEEPTSSTPWSVVAVLIVAATGLLWLLLKGRK